MPAISDWEPCGPRKKDGKKVVTAYTSRAPSQNEQMVAEAEVYFLRASRIIMMVCSLCFTARTGHTLTKLGNTNNAILFGGVSFERKESGFRVHWEKSCRDGKFYVLDVSSTTWSLVNVPSTKARAYHITNSMNVDGKFVVVVVGVTFDEHGSTPTREPLHEVLVMTIRRNFKNPVLQTVKLNSGNALSTPIHKKISCNGCGGEHNTSDGWVPA